jgi:hypothetical protein
MDPPPPPPPSAPPGAPPTGWSPPDAPAWGAPPPQRSSNRARWAIAIGAAVVVVGVALFVLGARGSSTSTSNGPVGNFTDPTSHFSAEYRDKPVQDDQSTSVGGRTINEVLWTDAIDTNTAEIVGYANFPADFSIAAPNAALDGSVAGEVSNIHGTLVSKNFGTYQGFTSVDAVISASGGYVESRAILAGRTLYIVVVTSTNNPPELFSGFANSLHILNHST